MSEPARPETGRRFLIATAVTQHIHAPSWNLPGMAAARAEIVELFTGTLGYEHVSELGLDPTRDQLTTRLRAFCRDPARRPDDMVAVYIGGHGDVLEESREHVLLTSDTDPADIDDALPTAELARKMLQGTHVRRVLLMLDTCYAGRGGNELAAAAMVRMTSRWGEDLGSGLIVLTSAQPTEEARPGAFPALLRAAVLGLPRTGYTAPTLPLDTVVNAMNRNPDRPAHQTITSTLAQLTGEVPPFLPNPRHEPPAEPGDEPETGPRRLDDRAYHNVAEGYLRWAANEWRYIELGDLGLEQDSRDANRVRRLTLPTMYISLQADPRTLVDRRRTEELRGLDEADFDAEVAQSLSRTEAIGSIVAGGPHPAVGTEPGEPDGITLEEAFDRHRLLVVLGHPGSGKSVMCQWLGYELVRHGRETLRRRGPEPFRLPIRFRVADYAKFHAARFAAGEPPGDVTEFLAANLPAGDIGYPAATLRAMFERALAEGQAVLLIDGLDELTDYRDEVIEALAGLVEQHVLSEGAGRSQAVLTSRIAGYDDVYLTVEAAAHYLIRPLSDAQIGQFVTRFFAEIHAGDQAGLFTEHLRRSKASVHRLARTPLLLTSMCSYWHRHYELPASRAKLYRRLLLDTGYRWRNFSEAGADSGLDRLLGDETGFLAMLSRVAIRIHDHHVDGRLLEEELLEVLDDALYGVRRLLDVDTRPVALKLVDRIREKIGILAEFANGEFGFIHQTFREYLAGLDLLRNGDAGPGELFGKIAERVGDPRWREPLLLALGECDSGTRMELMLLATVDPPLEPEQWVRIFLAAALERPAAETNPDELISLLKLIAHTYDAVNDTGDPVDELDFVLAEFRQHMGTGLFDFLALNTMRAGESRTAPLAALYWRQRWLTRDALEVLTAVAEHDSGDWDWPIQRALRHAAGPPQLRKVTYVAALEGPAEDEISAGGAEARTALRLFELGAPGWERRRRQAGRAVVAALPAGAFPVRELLAQRPELWRACCADEPAVRVLVALFGGLDHQDALRWVDEYEDFARVLQLPASARLTQIERRAAEFVPRYGVSDPVYRLALELDSVGTLVTLRRPAPTLAVPWLTRPSTPSVRGAVRRWLTRGPGHRDLLRQALRGVALTRPSPAERAEAELGLLVLDGTPMTPDAASGRALRRALESTADAMLRGHGEWFDAVWDPGAGFSPAERAALHQTLLRLFFAAAGRPVSLHVGGAARHPIRTADRMARSILAQSWGGDPVPLTLPAEEALAAVAWLTTLPYRTRPSRSPDSGKPALWHEDMPRAAQAARAGLGSALRALLAWVDRLDPWLEQDLHAALHAVFSLAAQADSATADSARTPELTELYRQLEAGRDATAADQLGRLRRVAGLLPPPHTDLAYLAIGLAQHAPEHEGPIWHHAALDLLAGEPDEAVLAEALSRLRPYLDDDPGALAVADRLAAGIAGPILRAHATGDLAAVAEELAGTVGAAVDPPLRVSLLAGARMLRELARIRDGTTETPAEPDPAGPLFGTLDGAALAVIHDHLAGDPEDGGAKVARLLRAVSRVDEAAVTPLTELLDGTPPRARWAVLGRNLLALQRIEAGAVYPEMFRDLVEVACAADTTNATKAYLKLLGPRRDVARDSRQHLLSAHGPDIWWELGREAGREPDPQRRWLFTSALDEWDIDDAGMVGELVRRLDNGNDADRAIWFRLLDATTIWRAGPQAALADWLDTVTDREAAEAGLLLTAMLLSSGGVETVSERLKRAAVRACERGGSTARFMPGVTRGDWRTALAGPVADACATALNATTSDSTGTGESSKGGGTGGTGRSGATSGSGGGGATGEVLAAVAQARRSLHEQTEPVVRVRADGTAAADLAEYGNLVWAPTSARPEDVVAFIGAGVATEPTIALLSEWARQLDAERGPYSPLGHATSEAVLSLLVVLSARDRTAFRLLCPPETMQPVLSRQVLARSRIAATAALILLGRLRFVDLVPAEGPHLIEVVDVALRRDPQIRVAAADFLRTVRHVRGHSPAQALLDRIAFTSNETVAHGFAGLAAAYLKSPSCSSADGRRIRQAFLADIARNGWWRPVHLVGSGEDHDPIIPVVGPDRRTEFRRLLRGG